MERIPKLTLELFTILFSIIGLSHVHCATVTTDDGTGILGDNVLNITCSYSLLTGESAKSMTISRRRSNEPDFIELAQFFIDTDQSYFSDNSDIQARSTLVLMADSTVISFSNVLCNDGGAYRCVFSYVANSVISNDQNDMNLDIQAMPTAPTFPAAFNPNRRSFVENEELEVKCEAEVGLPAGDFKWFLYRGSNSVDVTSSAVSSTPVNIGSGTRYCVFRRDSTLKLNLTRNDNKAVVRCVIDQTTLGGPPQPSDQCDADRCVQSDHIEVEYPIRQEDLQASSNPQQQEFIVGSAVTLKCTVDGNPEPYFTWSKDGDDSVTGPEGSDTWVLSDLSLGDTGTYRCMAQNNVSDVTYEASKAININVVATTTPAPTTQPPTTSPTTGKGGITGGVTGNEDDQTTTIIIAVCVVLGVLLLIAAIVAFIIIRKKRSQKGVEEPPEKPYSKNNMSMYNTKPDLVSGGDVKKQNYGYKNEDALNYADLKFDDKPRSRKPVALADITDYADITIPQV